MQSLNKRFESMSLYRWKQMKVRFAIVQDGRIQNHLPRSQWQNISEGDMLLKINDLVFSEKTAPATWTAAPATVTATATAMASAWRSWEDYAQAVSDWKKQKFIPGAAFLAPNGKLIYVSYIDMTYMEKVNATRS